MNNTDQLRQLMTLDADINTLEIELRFEQIAKMLFENFAIQKGETVYLFKEIEFYFYTTRIIAILSLIHGCQNLYVGILMTSEE